MSQKQQVKSVSEFVSLIEQYPNSLLFRGEEKNFEETKLVSSMLRTADNKRNFKYRCDLLHYRVFSSLTDNEREHFLAFAQHHGIPTNLLDVTTNPLVALWFACKKANDEDQDGIVYGFDDKCINMTDFINMIGTNYLYSKFYGDKGRWRSCFEDAIGWSSISLEEALISLFSTAMGMKVNMPIIIDELNDVLLPENNNHRPHRYSKWDEFITNLKRFINNIEFISAYDDKESIARAISTFIVDNIPMYLSEVEITDNSSKKLFYSSIERRIVARLLFFTYCENGDMVGCLPHVLYQPTLSFKRALSQHSLFIYQWYDNDRCQTLTPKYEIHVDKGSKEKIKSELRKYGINQGSIFGDNDNIAKDIMNVTMTSE